MVKRTPFENKTLKKTGARISILREAKGIKQAQLARDCAMDKSSINRLEAGLANPTIVTLSRIAEALGVTLKDLIFD